MTASLASPEAPRAGRPAAALALAAVAALLAQALFHPAIGYDSWWYHLPFSSFLWGIGGGREAFLLDPLIEARWQGFPLLWNWLQGLGWWVSGDLRGIFLPNLLLLAGFVGFVAQAFRLPAALVFLALLGSPLLLAHAGSSYLDLPVGLGVALVLLGGVALIDRLSEDGARVPLAPAAALLLGALIAGNSKHQGLLGAGAALLAWLPLALRASPQLGPRLRPLLLLWAAAALLAAATALRNAALWGNPLYPIEVSLGEILLFAGPESPDLSADYPRYLLGGWYPFAPPGPLAFLLSASELDWTLRGVAPWYSVDALAGLSPRIGPPSRTGGFGAVFMAAQAGLLVAQVARGRGLSALQRRLLAAGLLLVLLTSLLPRAHELRYWLHVPILLAVINLRFLVQECRSIGAARLIAAGLFLLALAQVLASPQAGLLRPRPAGPAALRAVMPDAAREDFRAGRLHCAAGDDSAFAYSAAVTGIPGRISRDAARCLEPGSPPG